LFGCKVVGGSLHLRLELMYDLSECSTVRLYHFGKVCWGVGFWFLVCFFSSEVNAVVGVGIASIGVNGSIGAAFGVGVGDSSIYSKGVPGAVECSCSSGSKVVSIAGNSSIGCSSYILDVAGGIVVVVAWINVVGFKCSLYEVWIMVLDSSILLQEVPVDGYSFVC